MTLLRSTDPSPFTNQSNLDIESIAVIISVILTLAIITNEICIYHNKYLFTSPFRWMSEKYISWKNNRKLTLPYYQTQKQKVKMSPAINPKTNVILSSFVLDSVEKGNNIYNRVLTMNRKTRYEYEALDVNKTSKITIFAVVEGNEPNEQKIQM